MKYVFQLGIILLLSFLGELIHALIPLPVPASIYGLILMLVCLVTKVIRLEWVSDTGDFLLQIMPLFFVPAAVGLIAQWNEISKLLVPIIIIVPLTTIIVMATAGWTTQAALKKRKRDKK